MTLLDPLQCHAVAGGARGATPWDNVSDLLAGVPRPMQPIFVPFPSDP